MWRRRRRAQKHRTQSDAISIHASLGMALAVRTAAALATIKDAGIAGVASYFTVEVSFFAIALPIGYVVYHGTTGEWLQLQDLSLIHI